MIKHLSFVALSCLAAVQSFGQNTAPVIPRCGFDILWKKYTQADPSFLQRFQQLQSQPAAMASAKTTNTIYRIPVVFHVVYNTPDENLPDSVILNQIDVLNGAYRKKHADTGNLRNIFKPLSADAQIEFFLATVDPQGNPTNGIVRKQTTITEFGDFSSIITGSFDAFERIKSDALGGSEQWDPKRYLNIWSADLSFPGFGIAVLGYATPPINPLPPNWPIDAGTDELRDGVVIQYQTVGNNNPLAATVPGATLAGRTAVHEVGHYLGMRHIWGDADGTPDSCTADGDDGITDTPDQSTSSDISASGCPSASQNTCGSGTPGDLPDLWENYMDYSPEPCQSMFTEGQAALMRSICGLQRDSLTIKVPTSILGVSNNESFSVFAYPQPASQQLNLRTSAAPLSLQLFSVTGVLVKEQAASSDKTQVIDVSSLVPGTYILRVIARNGTKTMQVIVSR